VFKSLVARSKISAKSCAAKNAHGKTQWPAFVTASTAIKNTKEVFKRAVQLPAV